MAEKQKKPKVKKSKKYSIENDSLKKGKFCPKCGPGVFMADHKDRFSCGKCSYTEKK